MKKKAQLQVMQTIFIVLFLFVLLSIFVIIIMAKNRSNTIERLEQLEVMSEYKKSQIIDNLPELRCSFENVILNDCYDKLFIDLED